MKVIDTNVLIEYPEILFDETDITLPIQVIEELDKLKRDRYVGNKARKALNIILETNTRIEVLENFEYTLPLDISITDNKILLFAYIKQAELITNDLALYIKATNANIKAKLYSHSIYKGYKIVSSIEDFENYKFNENEYVICSTGEMVYRNGRFENLILPPATVIKGLNAYQRCALDLLYSNIPINIIIGKAGSGKTKLASEIAYYLTVEKNKYQHIVLIRNPIGSGEEIGFLPGKYNEKIQMFFDIFKSAMNEEVYTHLIEREIIQLEIPYYMKGKTYENSFIIVDEAEDLDLKTLKLIGTRIGKNSKLVIIGDINQTENKYLSNNGLINIIYKFKNNPLVGIIYLEEDVRSEASKLFADL